MHQVRKAAVLGAVIVVGFSCGWSAVGATGGFVIALALGAATAWGDERLCTRAGRAAATEAWSRGPAGLVLSGMGVTSALDPGGGAGSPAPPPWLEAFTRTTELAFEVEGMTFPFGHAWCHRGSEFHGWHGGVTRHFGGWWR